MADTTTQELLQRLNEQHQAYLETFKLVHEALHQRSAAAAPPEQLPPPPPLARTETAPVSPTITSISTRPSIPRNLTPSTPSTSSRRPPKTLSAQTTLDGDGMSATSSGREPKTPTYSSIITGESDESDADDEDLFVQTPLPSYSYEDRDLQMHLKDKGLTRAERIILHDVLDIKKRLFEHKTVHEAEGIESCGSIFDIGVDGTPVERKELTIVKQHTRDTSSSRSTKSLQDTVEVYRAFWDAIRVSPTGPGTAARAVRATLMAGNRT